jgi:hypothetical protein
MSTLDVPMSSIQQMSRSHKVAVSLKKDNTQNFQNLINIDENTQCTLDSAQMKFTQEDDGFIAIQEN